MDKMALLDTDFISKTCRISDCNDLTLCDLITSLSGYYFFCHAQIMKEMNIHHQKASRWLDESITSCKIHCYSDIQILDELAVYYGDLMSLVYANMLKEACNAFSRNLFQMYYPEIESYDFASGNKEKFVDLLEKEDEKMGKNKNLGEIKTYVLLQFLSIKYGEQIYIFCSDDKNTRNGIVNLANVRCISVLSSFLRMRKEKKWEFREAYPYVNAYVNLCAEYKQISFKVIEESDVSRMIRVPCEQVLRDIFDDKFIELKNGTLKYKKECD